MHYLGRPKISKRDKRLRTQKIKQITSAIAFIGALVAIWIIVSLLSSPTNGHSTRQTLELTKPTVSAPAPLVSPPPLNNNYFTLNLPPGYAVQHQSSSSAYGNLYGQSIIGVSSSGNLIIDVSVYALDSSGLSGNSAYAFRIQNSGQYIQQNMTYDGQSVSLFTDNQTGNIVSFWVHGDDLGTISVESGYTTPIGDSTANPAVPLINTLLSNWHWK